MLFQEGNIELSPRAQAHRNVIRYDNVDYLILPLSNSYNRSKGGNSNVFKIKDPNTNVESIIKISKFDINRPIGPVNNVKRIARFNREIEALQIAKEMEFQNVISYHFDDYVTIGTRQFHYYAMEKADYDLTTYLDSTTVSVQQRFLLCVQILNGIKELHSENIYHRDIKPDNILYVNKVWKIGDLGLVDHRNSDFPIREVGERIGPIGWLSPEAGNKFLNEGGARTNPLKFDCKLDEFSDIFQLGKLFWYIFQGNIPIGQIRREDFKVDDAIVYEVLKAMLMHSKQRPTLTAIETSFKSRYTYYNI